MTPKVEKEKKYLSCSCGYTNKKESGGIVKEVMQNKAPQNEYVVISEDDTTLPLTEEKCPECGHGQAYWWTKQMRASDEPETKFLRCEKCKHTWRDRS